MIKIYLVALFSLLISTISSAQVNISVFGAEPHWGAKVSGNKIVINDIASMQEIIIEVESVKNIVGRNETAGFLITGNSKEHSVQIIVEKANECPCNIDMAGDEPFEYTAYMVHNGNLFEGCGRKN